MTLTIISPEKTVFQGEVTSATFPGASGSFTVLNNHAPIISTLTAGTVVYAGSDQQKNEVNISGGIVEVHANVITLCIK